MIIGEQELNFEAADSKTLGDDSSDLDGGVCFKIDLTDGDVLLVAVATVIGSV